VLSRRLTMSAMASTSSAVAAAREPPSSAEPTHAPVSTGLAALRQPESNRGLATDVPTRRRRRLEGLLPAAVTTPAVEVRRALESVRRALGPLDKYRAAMAIYSADQDAFVSLLQNHATEILPYVYTPTVGDACLNWGALVPTPPGLYLAPPARCRDLVANWPHEDIRVAVVTNGERVLGLGDLGAHGMPISIGKGLLYTACGIHPSHILPVVVDVGTDNEALMRDPLYIGLRQPRLRGAPFTAFMDEVVDALRERYGASLIVHFEDFGASTAWDVLHRYRQRDVCVFNDDIEGTAAAVVAAVLGSLRVDGVAPLHRTRLLFYGAGQANLGAARLVVKAMTEAGMDRDEAASRVWLMDSRGLIYKGRGHLSDQKVEFAHPLSSLGSRANGLDTQDLVACIRATTPSVLLGAAAQRGAFTREVVEAHTAGVAEVYGPGARPVILALSNPTSKAECTAEEALTWSGGHAVFASGTAFPPVALPGGCTYVPAQSNNALVFPGVVLGAFACGASQITESMFLAAARTLAQQLTPEELERGMILPSIQRLMGEGLASAAEPSAEGAAGDRRAAWRTQGWRSTSRPPWR